MTIDSMTFKSRCGSVVEHFLGKEEVMSSILINGSYNKNGMVNKVYRLILNHWFCWQDG